MPRPLPTAIHRGAGDPNDSVAAPPLIITISKTRASGKIGDFLGIFLVFRGMSDGNVTILGEGVTRMVMRVREGLGLGWPVTARLAIAMAGHGRDGFQAVTTKSHGSPETGGAIGPAACVRRLAEALVETGSP